MSHRVLLGSGSEFTRQLFHKSLEPLAMRFVGDCSKQADLLSDYHAHHPDLVIVDLSIEGGGTETTRALLESHPEAKVILCAAQAYLSEARTSQAWGVREILLKPFHPEKLQELAIQVLMG